MKNLFQFLSEASRATDQARKLKLKTDGHGGWYDQSGEFVAKTEGEKLKFYDKGRKVGEKDQPNKPKTAAVAPKALPAKSPEAVMAKRRKDDDLAGAPKQKSSEDEGKTSDGGEESKDNTLTIVFGRFNPPTAGHEKLLSAAEKIAVGGELKIYPSRTQDDKKNPLDPDMKVSYMRKMFPKFKEQIINDSEMNTIFDVLTTADQNYANVNIVVGADRQGEFENLSQKYNKELYDFDLIRVISAGPRDADAEGIEGVSSSKQRKAVMDDDFESFKKGTPKGLSDGDSQALFDAVRNGMKKKKSNTTKESYNLWEIAPRLDKQSLRENYIMKNIFRIGDIVENLNTGLIGRIIRRGTNHLICVTKEDYMFKSWIRDVMEYTEVHMKRKNRLPGKPNTLVGTTGYLKNAMAATGTKKIKNFNIEEFINKYKIKK